MARMNQMVDRLPLRRGLAAGRAVPLADSLGDGWFEHEPEVMYAQSGSFVCFLPERDGDPRFSQLYPRAGFQVTLSQLYGADLATIEGEWLDRLRRGTP